VVTPRVRQSTLRQTLALFSLPMSIARLSFVCFMPQVTPLELWKH
jgi:hypothetical protein